MPRISWNEIETRAFQFAAKWQGETYERGESQTFWGEFLSIFDIDRRRQGAYFEYAIKKLNGKQGFIDLFWPGMLLAEQKSAGRDLTKASVQALDYIATMPDHDLPRFIVTSDFASFELLELATGKRGSFPLERLPERVRSFEFLFGDTGQTPAEENPVNREAAEGMARLHNQLRDSRYAGHDLEMLLVRIMFCLFADDAFIFDRGAFERYIRTRTSPDGSDLGSRLNELFEVLDTAEDQRQTTLDQDLQAFPYINGGLFAGRLRTPACTSAMRQELLAVMRLNWREVSPAIFGAMFQGVMDETQRRNLGAHYTSERNILRVIKPLFLDELYADYKKAWGKPRELDRLLEKLSRINVLDPACGCGNFLVITYRELRRLEHKILKDRYPGQLSLNVTLQIRLNVDQMHGIEIEEFPSRIAQTALWLTDHQMNLEASATFGEHFARLPLTTSANIVNVNALTTDWRQVVNPSTLTYILGNPPFLGKQYQSITQKDELAGVFAGVAGAGVLDFVTAWYAKAIEIMKSNPTIETAFVSTNSITQGEQVGVFWKHMMDQGSVVTFAHRTFRWANEAKGVAAVFCVVVGFSLKPKSVYRIFDYPNIRGEPIELLVKTINPYLIDAPTVFLSPRRIPFGAAPAMKYGSKPVDNGHYMFTEDERIGFVERHPGTEMVFRRIIGSHELINGITRWCLWLRDVSPGDLRKMPAVIERIEHVRSFRRASRKEPTRRAAETPMIFTELRQPESDYLAVPEVSSETRSYLPTAFVDQSVIANNKVYTIANADRYQFAMLASQMHMAWMRAVCGRLKSDYQYSAGIVYNNFPWPDATEKQLEAIGLLGQGILDARARYPDSTLADLYDPLTMPPELRKAHEAVDRAVDRLYAPRKTFAGDTDRLVVLFTRYQQLTAGPGVPVPA